MNTIDDFKPIEEETNDLRLQVILSKGGVASRRKAVDLIESGRVQVNGQTIREPGFRVRQTDAVLCDGEKVKFAKHMYVLLNKPVGYVCSNDDPEGRNLAVDLLIPYKDLKLFSIGRLDFMSSGLIIFTNDGQFANLVSHPRYGFEKEYIVETKTEMTKEFLEEFKTGIYADGERYRIKSYRFINPLKVHLILQEGKNREIRNAFGFRKITIRKLERIRVGSIKIGTLETGRFRPLQEFEIEWFRENAKGSGRGNRH